ncbi:MAG: ubiquitin carboxyl-terminal hydrolase family protein [Bacteroidota bacterium]
MLSWGGGTFFYFQYGGGKESDKNPEKPLKDWNKDDLKDFIDSSGVGDEAKRKKLNEKIKEKDVTAENLDDLPTIELIKELELEDEYKPLLSEIKEKLKEGQEDDGTEKSKSLFGIETQKDLVNWINSLKTLTQAQKEGLVKTVKTNGMTGEDLLSLENQQEIEESFKGIDSTVAKTLYDAFIELKRLPQPKVGPNSGVTGLQNFNGEVKNVCFINAGIQLLLQNPPLAKELRGRKYFNRNKYVTKKESDTRQDMWADLVEISEKSLQDNAKQTSANPVHVVRKLEKTDVIFPRDETGYSIQALSKMTEVLNEDYFHRAGGKLDETKADWIVIGSKPADLEKNVTEFYNEYNPKEVSSPIRKMHFMMKTSLEAVGLPEKHKHAEDWYHFEGPMTLAWENPVTDVVVDFYDKEKGNVQEITLKDIDVDNSAKCLQYMIFDQLKATYKKLTAEDIKIGYFDMDENKKVAQFVPEDFLYKKTSAVNPKKKEEKLFDVRHLLKKRRYIFACLEGTKDLKVNFPKKSRINQIHVSPRIKSLQEGIDLYLKTRVQDDRTSLYKKKYIGGQVKKELVKDEDNPSKVPVLRRKEKIVKYPEVWLLALNRVENNKEFDHKFTFEKTMKRDGNTYHLAGVAYRKANHYWSHVKSIDDGKWYEVNDSDVTEIGDDIMKFVRGGEGLKLEGGGELWKQGHFETAGSIWKYVKEEKDS